MSESELTNRWALALRDAVASRLEESGWRRVDKHGSTGATVLAFTQRLNGQFAATAEIVVDYDSERGSVSIEDVGVGVSYEPCRTLFALLVGDSAGLATIDEDPRYIDDPDQERSEWSIRIRRAGDVAAAADRLAAEIVEHGVVFARRHADVDVLLAEHGADDPEEMSLTVPVLLTAAGRFDEARAAIASYPQDDGAYSRRICRQLERYIDAGGDKSVIEPVPPPVIFVRPQRVFFRDSFREARATREAIDAVRDRAGDLPREQQKTMLTTELARRGIEKRPLWVEHRLDEIADPQRSGSSLGALMKLGKAGLTLLRDGIPDQTQPDWLQPPEHAAYRVLGSPKATAVLLDPDAAEYLHRVYEAASKIARTASLDAWIDRTADDHSLAVHLGERRVGRIEPACIDDFSELMAAAEAIDELPRLRARLAPVGTGYVLELDRPLLPADSAWSRRGWSTS